MSLSEKEAKLKKYREDKAAKLKKYREDKEAKLKKYREDKWEADNPNIHLSPIEAENKKTGGKVYKKGTRTIKDLDISRSSKGKHKGRKGTYKTKTSKHGDKVVDNSGQKYIQSLYKGGKIKY